MDGFKKIVKMKTGGAVSKAIAAYEKKESKSEGKMDLAQDKSMVKKGVRQHESALHKNEPKTELKLKTGGRAKKAVGTVKKFEKASGEYGAKKTASDKKNIKEAKQFKPAFKCGGNVKKMADGKQVGASAAQQKYYDTNKANAKVKEDKAMYEAIGSRGDAARKGMAEGRMDALGNAYKKGGKAKVKKFNEGGYTGDDPIVKYRMGMSDTAATPSAAAAPREDMIEDESGRGVVTPEQAAYSKSAPGSEPATPRAVARTVKRRAAPVAAKPGILDRIKNWAASSNKYTSVPSGNAMKKGGKACK